MLFYSVRAKAWARVLELRSRIRPGAYMSLSGVVGRQIDVSVTGRPLVKRNPTESGETDQWSRSLQNQEA
jgi:hypothetical protein